MSLSSVLAPSLSVSEQLRSLTALVGQLRQEVGDLRRENDELRQQVRDLTREVGYWKNMHARAVQRNEALETQFELANAEIRQLKDERFGKRSEKRSTTDRSNDLDDPQQLAIPKKKRGQQPGRPAPQRRDYSHLPMRKTQIDLPDDAKVCTSCGKPLADHGQSVANEQIEIESVVYRQVVSRKRYRRTCDCHDQPQTVTAPPPPKLLPKSIYGTSLWTHFLLEKFHLQRPTHRTIEQLRLLGLSLASGTIADGLKRIEPLLTPIYDAIRTHHIESRYFHADETRWRVFAEKAGKTGPRWWLWVFAGEDSVVFVIDPSRSHDIPQSHFPGDAQGVLIVDRYSGYKAMQQVKQGHLKLAFCWAHVRRDFVRVGKGYPELTEWALGWLRQIRDLYYLNRQRLQHEIGTPEFAAADAVLRQHVQAMAQDRDHELAADKLRQPCRKALVSLKEHWSGLALFVDDPRIPLDNNYGERLIRNPAVGRKNYYGSGSEWSGRLAMKMFSIFATLALWKINPRTWLNEYFDACAANGGEAPHDLSSFLPWKLTETRLATLHNSASDEVLLDTS